MGVLNLASEPYHHRKIASALRLRGMILVTDEDWEIHGPHENFNYQVYVGYAEAKDDPSDCPLVAIYPRAVYEIEDRSDWGRVTPENKIPIGKE